jgi:hypothetical protein
MKPSSDPNPSYADQPNCQKFPSYHLNFNPKNKNHGFIYLKKMGLVSMGVDRRHKMPAPIMGWSHNKADLSIHCTSLAP